MPKNFALYKALSARLSVSSWLSSLDAMAVTPMLAVTATSSS
nr:hypothetical protein [Halomonas azerica]